MYHVYFPNNLSLILGTVDNPQTVRIIKNIPNLLEKVVKGIYQTGNFNVKPTYISHVPDFKEPIKYFNINHNIMWKQLICYAITNKLILFPTILLPTQSYMI